MKIYTYNQFYYIFDQFYLPFRYIAQLHMSMVYIDFFSVVHKTLVARYFFADIKMKFEASSAMELSQLLYVKDAVL